MLRVLQKYHLEGRPTLSLLRTIAAPSPKQTIIPDQIAPLLPTSLIKVEAKYNAHRLDTPHDDSGYLKPTLSRVPRKDLSHHHHP